MAIIFIIAIIILIIFIIIIASLIKLFKKFIVFILGKKTKKPQLIQGNTTDKLAKHQNGEAVVPEPRRAVAGGSYENNFLGDKKRLMKIMKKP